MATSATEPDKSVVSAFELPGKSARLITKHWKLFAFVNLPFILLAVPALFGNAVSSRQSSQNLTTMPNPDEIFAIAGFGLVFGLVFLLVSLFFYAMTIKLSLEVTADEKPNVQSLVNAGAKFWLRLLGLSLVLGVIIVAGLILLIIPGLIAAVLLVFAPLILIDKNTSITEAIKGSYRMVTANAGPVLGALAIFIGLMITGSIIMEIPYIGPVLGTIVSILFSLIMYFRYQELKTSAEVL